VKPEGVVGAVQVVVDRLGHSYDRQSVLLEEPGRDTEGVLAADGHKCVQARSLDCVQDAADAAVELVGVRPRGAEDGSSAGQDPRDLARPERLELVLDQPSPPVPDADNLVPALERPAPDGTDDRVQARAVSAAGEDAYLHLSIFTVSRGSLRQTSDVVTQTDP